MREGSNPVLVRREDYTAPSHWIRSVDLTFDLEPAKTLVINRMRIEPNADRPGEALRLDGEAITLTRVLVNGESVSFRNEGGQLVLDKLPTEAFDLEIRNTCAPEKNTELSGLYTSQGAFFTQCEAQGFRRITYFLDRPDVMAVFKVTLKADAKAYPVLLSNGNLVEAGKLDKGRHYAVWSDPHPKPSYLFALVAGNLVCREQKIRSRSGRDHLLQVYVRAGDLDKTEHAMNSLIASVAWDEARFGLSLDLERFMIVAVSDFNMGAMENKGLNIFNTKFVLANPATATDVDFGNVEGVVGHEYFHNWTGNRITCRDWFQLSLKEGLTVYRDQEFSQDMAGEASARAVKRIEDVRQLRQFQFVEDAGPMAHPVRPDQYQAIDNFYTATVYEKGAEVVRMMATLVGRAGFRRGMDLYFQRHDGQAVTCDDFAQAIADANPDSALALRLEAFKRWYAQAGTPRVSASGQFDAVAGTYTLTLAQRGPATPGQPEKLPFVIPVALGLIAPDGVALPLQLEGEAAPHGTERVLVLDQPSETWVFTGLGEMTAAPVPSLLRGFSAPVVLEWAAGEADLFTLLAHDHDAYNRWEAGQKLALTRLLAAAQADGAAVHLDEAFLQAMHPAHGLPAGHAPGAARRAPGRRLQGPGADAAQRGLRGRTPGRTGRADRPAAHPRRARDDAPAAGAKPARRLGLGLGDAPGQRRLPPRPAVGRPSRPGQPGAGDAGAGRRSAPRPAVARPGLPACEGRRQHDRPLWRAGGLGECPCVAGRAGAGALPCPVQRRSAGARQVVRPAGRRQRARRPRLRPHQGLGAARRLHAEEPQPRPQPADDLHAQPGRAAPQ